MVGPNVTAICAAAPPVQVVDESCGCSRLSCGHSGPDLKTVRVERTGWIMGPVQVLQQM